jgi:hypothetical protein
VKLRSIYPHLSIFQGDIIQTLYAIIPTGTWLWKTLEGAPVFESLRILAARKTHLMYLNRRDTFRSKNNMMHPSRWSQYNMHLATYLTGIRPKCAPRVRGHQSKQLYDWTTHAVNLAKGITNDLEREQQSKCRLCNLDEVENQIHTSTSCTHVELIAIRNIYKKEINSILLTFSQCTLKSNEEWIKKVINYVTNHLWLNTPTSSDIWNGRWTRHMWYDVLDSNVDKPFALYDFTSFRKWMKLLTSKLFETQSALSRHRFRLVKRLGDPMFERSKYTPGLIKKRLQENMIIYIPEVRSKPALKQKADDAFRVLGINKERRNRIEKLLPHPNHGNSRTRQMNLKDCNFPSKRRIDEVILSSPECSLTTSLPSQKKRRRGSYLVHGGITRSYNCVLNTKRTICELNGDSDSELKRLLLKYIKKRKIYSPVGLLSNLTRKYCYKHSKHQ